MFCNQCGATLAAGARFCGVCGKPVAEGPIAPPGGTTSRRVASHRTIVAALWIVYSSYLLLGALTLEGLGHFFAGDNRFLYFGSPWAAQIPPFVGPLLGTIGVFLLVAAIAGICAGVGLLQLQPWGRIWAILLAFVALLHPPFGTLLGIYTLWVLLPAASDREFDQLQRARASRTA